MTAMRIEVIGAARRRSPRVRGVPFEGEREGDGAGPGASMRRSLERFSRGLATSAAFRRSSEGFRPSFSSSSCASSVRVRALIPDRTGARTEGGGRGRGTRDESHEDGRYSDTLSAEHDAAGKAAASPPLTRSRLEQELAVLLAAEELAQSLREVREACSNVLFGLETTLLRPLHELGRGRRKARLLCRRR